MLIDVGKRTGRLVEAVMLEEADHIARILYEESPDLRLSQIQAEIRRLMVVFDRRSYAVGCYAAGCSNRATRCSVYLDNVFWPKWWCDECDPYKMGADKGKLQIIRYYQDALTHVVQYCAAYHDESIRLLIIRMVEAKGVVPRPEFSLGVDDM